MNLSATLAPAHEHPCNPPLNASHKAVINMNGLHNPSTVYATRPPTQANGAEPSLTDLIAQRDNLEAELKALGEVLVSHNVDMNTPLLTRDGFPRSDIDVAQIRTTRARIIWLRNDYKALMNRIEAGLHAHHAALQAGTATSASTPASSNPTASHAAVTNGFSIPAPSAPHAFANSALEPPFAKVNSVVSGSPAEAAGLKAGDEVRRFGVANWTNHERLAHVAQIVQRSEDREILVKVKRKEGNDPAEELDLTLIPRRNWGGRGMLGCHLVPA